MSTSNNRRRTQSIHVRLTPDEYILLIQKLDVANQDIKLAAKQNSVDVTRLALLTMQNLLVDAALGREINKPIILPASVDIAGRAAALKDVKSELAKQGAMLKALITGKGTYYSQGDKKRQFPLEVTASPTSTERTEISTLLRNINLEISKISTTMEKLL